MHLILKTFLLLVFLAVSACTKFVPQTKPVTAKRAIDLKLKEVKNPDLGLENKSMMRALAILRNNCERLLVRHDQSGLTRREEWTTPCNIAQSNQAPRDYFERYFTWVEVAGGYGLNTGYFEATVRASLIPDQIYRYPIYRRPDDMLKIDLSDFGQQFKGKHITGRLEQMQGKVVLRPYHDRKDIENGALVGKGLEIAWTDDPYEYFFMQIQGSGQLLLPDGRRQRISYDSGNGRPYTSIGKLLLQRGEIKPGNVTMESILNWLQRNPQRAFSLMQENQSWVFYKFANEDLIKGSLAVPLTPERSIAVDPRFIPLGAPVWLETGMPDTRDLNRTTEFSKLVWAQDTGGAIKGPNRIDIFWGDGNLARAVAGRTKHQGHALILIPKASGERLRRQGLLK